MSGTYGKPAPEGATAQGFRTFEDLEVYQVAREFRKEMYAVARGLPAFEKFGLADQIRRAAVSVTNNIAEGHGRYHYLEQIKLTLYSRGSVEELQDELNVCADEGYLPDTEIERLKTLSCSVHKLINGYLCYLRERKCGHSLQLKESPGTNDFELEDLFSNEL
jgi:four helix bundle protein